MNSFQILAVGNELLRGEVADTNTALIARKLRPLGFQLSAAALVADSESEIAARLRQALADGTELLILTGGLGPTSDDLTRNAIASVANVSLLRDEAAAAELRAFFERRKRPFSETNLRQADFPEAALQLENPVGTARGFALRIGNCWVLALPGVPREMSAMLETSVAPFLQRTFGNLAAPAATRLKIFGISESLLAEKIEVLNLPPEVFVAYRPMFPEIEVSLHAAPGKDAAVQTAAELIFQELTAKHVFAVGADLSLAECVHQLLLEQKITLALAESCTGGLVAHKLVSLPGSSQYLRASVVSYADEAKEIFLGVPRSHLQQSGAVSEETVRAMAWGAKFRTGADLAVAITGIAGPNGGSVEKPVGTVWIALHSAELNDAQKFFVPYERNMMREYTAALALNWIRLTLAR